MTKGLSQIWSRTNPQKISRHSSAEKAVTVRVKLQHLLVASLEASYSELSPVCLINCHPQATLKNTLHPKQAFKDMSIVVSRKVFWPKRHSYQKR